jgi:biotin transport system substrate-specific component
MTASDQRRLRVAREIALIMAGTALVAACAQVHVPMWPVPATLQSFAVLLIGATFGARRGAITLLAYLAEGASGLPVFAGFGAGFARLIGPTAGYLWAFPIAAFAVGALVERGWDRRISTALLALLAGDLIILAAGFAWIAASIGAAAAWTTGVAPFLIFNSVKIALTAASLPIGRRLLDRLAPR